MNTRILRVCMVVVVASACASGSASSGATEGAPARTTTSRDVITREELSTPSMQTLSVLDAVRSLRPQFLAERGKNSSTNDESGKVHASVDNGKIGPLSELGSIQANIVVEVRYLNPAQAMQKFGGQALQGPVILVLTR